MPYGREFKRGPRVIVRYSCTVNELRQDILHLTGRYVVGKGTWYSFPLFGGLDLELKLSDSGGYPARGDSV